MIENIIGNAHQMIDHARIHYSSDRYRYHTIEHINRMLRKVPFYVDEYHLSERDEMILRTAIIFHDIVYDSRKKNNEEESARHFVAYVNDCIGDKHLSKNDKSDLDCFVTEVETLILATKNHDSNFKYEERSLKSIIVGLDISIVYSNNFNELLAWEHGIFKEYQWSPLNSYVEKRIEFLEKYKSDNINALIEYVKNREYKIGIYAGSFRPFHVGHLNIVQKAEEVFDKVVIAKGQNPDKENIDYFDLPVLENQVVKYSGLVTSMIRHQMSGAPKNTKFFLVRGLRNEHDIAMEENFRRIVHDIDRKINFMYFFCDKEFEHVSSSIIRGLIPFDKDAANRYIVY